MNLIGIKISQSYIIYFRKEQGIQLKYLSLLHFEFIQNTKIYTNMAFKGAIEVDTQRCKGCSVCVENCPTKSIGLSRSVNNKGYHYAEMIADTCIGCSSCAVVCPDSVITVYRVKIQ